MENEVDLSSSNPLDLTPKGSLAIENIDTIKPISPQRPVPLAQNNPVYPGQGQGVMGTNRMLVNPTPDANPLDNAERLLTEQRNRLQGAASRPWGQFLFPEESRKWEEEAAQKSLQIKEIQDKRQQQQDIQAAARNRGLTRTLGPNATQETLTEESLREMKEGNYNAFKGLVGAGQGARAQLYMPEFVQSLGKQTEAGQKVVEELNKAPDQKQYNDIRNGILKNAKDGKHEYSASSLGLDENNIPKTKLEWEKTRGAATAKLNDASALVEQFKQQQNSLSQAIPISDEKVAKSVTDNISGSTGEAFPNTQAVTLPGAGGAQGAEFKQPGSKDLANYKKEWDNLSPAEIKTASEQLNSEQFKGVLGKYKTSKDFFLAAMDDGMYKRSAGLAALNDKFGAVERNVAEGSKGSGTIGLTKQLENQYGVPEHLANAVVKARSEIKSWIEGGSKGPLPKLSAQSIEGMKYVATATYNQDKNELDRLALPAYTIGYRGGGMDKLGVDKEIQNEPYLKEINERGTEKYRLDVDKYPFIVKGDKRIALRQDAQVPGMIPAGAYAKTLTPAEQRGTGVLPAKASATPTTTPGSPSPSGGGGNPPIVPTSIAQNPVALTVYGAAGEAAASAGGTTAMARNVATVVTSAANSESSFNPNATHDGGIGYGLFGHNQDRLKAMQTFAGTKPGEPIKPETQAAFFAKELAQAASKDQFIKDTVNNPNAGAVDLTKVQIRLEKPTGYTGPGSEEKIPSWQSRLNNTRALMQGGTALTVKQAEENYYKAASQVPTKLANIAPAIGSVVGGIGGTALGGPIGGAAGAVGGGAAGGAVRQAVLGGSGYVDQTIRGAAEGIPMAVPGIGPARIAARVAAGGLVPAAEKLYDTGGEDVAGAIESGAAGAAGGITGEAFGRALGMAGHKIFSHLATGSQAEVQAAAKVLATQEPKIADATGKMVPNTAYDKAEQFVKDRGLDVEHAAYAYNVSKQGVPKGEALAQRPGAVEAAKVGKEYDAIREDITASQGATRNINVKNLQDGPASLVRTSQNPSGTVPAKYERDAIDAQMRVTAPAKDWTNKWQQLGATRSDLLKKERDALASTTADKTERAEAMRALADSVRVQQEKVAKHVLGAKAQPLIDRLEVSDVRYRRAMEASGDGNIVKAIAKGGPEGRAAQSAFDALAANDPAAQRMVRALVASEKGVGGRASVAGAIGMMAIPLHSIPVVGTAAALTAGTISSAQGIRLLNEYMVRKGAGAPVKFETMLKREIASKGYAARAGSVIGSSIGGQAAQ